MQTSPPTKEELLAERDACIGASRKPGPKGRNGEHSTISLRIRITPSEWVEFKRLSRQAGMSLAGYVRHCVFEK